MMGKLSYCLTYCENVQFMDMFAKSEKSNS